MERTTISREQDGGSASIANQSLTQEEIPYIKPRAWTSSDAARFPLTTPDIDPWTTCLAKAKTYDKARIDSWKDEVDKVLVFAALFSAITTAFALESSKSLEDDHQASTAMFLFLIHRQLDSIARQNLTTLPPIIDTYPGSAFQVPLGAVTTNSCFFVSLTLSLTAAALGILCLQWLREHQKEPNRPAEELFPLRAFRIRMVDELDASVFIGMLQLLLLAALLAFLFGLSLFIRNLGSAMIAFIAFFALFVLIFAPVYNRYCVYRSPQAWLLYHFVAFLLKPLQFLVAGGTEVAKSWRHFRGRLPNIQGPASTIRNLENWYDWDKYMVDKMRHSGFQWYAPAFAHDREATLAFVQCADLKISQSRNTEIADELRDEIEARVEEMVSLAIGKTWKMQDDGVIHLWPFGLAFDVAMAYCIDYATKVQPSLLPILFVRRSELHLRILSTSFTIPTALRHAPNSDVLADAIQHFAREYRGHTALVGALPQGFHDHVCSAIWLGFSTQSADFQSSLDLLYVLRPEPDHRACRAAIVALNGQLEEALANDAPVAEKEAQLRMVVAYVCGWLSCHSLTPANKADISQWPTGPTASFVRLAQIVIEQEQNHPALRQALQADIDILRNWCE